MLKFDSTEEFDGILSPELFEFMKTRYWVCVFRDRKATLDSWCMSVNEPMPVPNPQMYWRRPTWEECLDVMMIMITPWLEGTQTHFNREREAYESGKARNHKYAVEWTKKRNVFNGEDYPVAI